MADFDKAIAALPTEWGASDYGRVTKGAAMAMKARAALYYGNWDTAATEAKNVMDRDCTNCTIKIIQVNMQSCFGEKLTDVMSSSLLLSSTIRIRPII
ncbi:hypothetical protein NXX33_22100 [Bacteroides fragilis]|nr:hypothetical protein [Bacteroides fragilis]